MGSRYFITGVQLGMLKVFIDNGDFIEFKKMWDIIYSEQYLCDSIDRCPFWLKKEEI